MSKQNESKGTRKLINEVIFKFDEEGTSIRGVVLEVSPHKFKDAEKEVNKYKLQTAEGKIISFVGGAGLDMSLNGVNVIGKDLEFLYTGKTDIGKGRSVNTFEVWECE